MFCPNCGKPLSVEDGLFCPSCGARLPQRKSTAAEPPVLPVDAPAKKRPAPVPTPKKAKKPKKKKKGSAGLLAGLIGGGLVLVGLALFFLVIRPELQRVRQYNEGVDLLNEKDYAAASDLFAELGNYADSAQMVDYATAMEAMEAGNYKKAANLFSDLGDFMDAPEQLAKAKGELLYADALATMQQGNYREALASFEQIPTIRDAEELAKTCRNYVAFEDAQALYASGSYREALARLKDVSGIPEAEDLRRQCESWIVYADAKAKYDAGAYQEALTLLEGVRDVPEAESLKKDCEDRVIYAKALEKYNAGDYQEAADLFSQVPKVENASTLLKECQKKVHFDKIQVALSREDWKTALKLLNDSLAKDYPDRANLRQLCQNRVQYAEAVQALSEGKNYTAYVAFTALGDYEDAAAKAKSCIVSKPKNGELYRNSKYKRNDCDQILVMPNDGYYTYMKIYAKKGNSEELVSTLFIHPGKTLKIHLPAGEYIIKAAYGKGNWFGPEEMFGDDGQYIRAGGSTYVFTRKSGYEYTTKFRVGGGGNTGQASVSRDGF